MSPDKNDLDYVSFLKQLVTSKRLEGAAMQIAEQACAQGPDSLSVNQTATLESAVKAISPERCGCCNDHIPWLERYQAIESGWCLDCTLKD